MKSKIVAVIPVREGSQRVKNKNFRPFASYPNLLSLKIEQLKEEACFDHIYVSSDSKRAQQIAEKHGAEFLARDPKMCSSSVRWAPVIHHVVSTIPGEPIIAWVHTTSPLQQKYKPAIETFLQQQAKYDSLVIVRRVQEFLIKANGRPLNYCWGHWHDYSQDLEPLYVVTGALFVAKKADILKWHYLIGTQPYLYEVSRLESIDLDSEKDFRHAEMLFRITEKNKKY